MRKPHAAALTLPLCLAASLAADWPHWRGPDRDGTTPEVSGWPSAWPPKRLWGTNVGVGCTSPIVVGDRLYVMGWRGKDKGIARPGGRDTLYCFDLQSGRVLWRQSYPCRYQGRLRKGDERQYGGPLSTPSFDKATGFIYTLSVDGDLRCWDARRDGKPVWGMNLHEKFTIKRRPFISAGHRDYGHPTSPLVHGDLLIVEVGDTKGTVVAFDKKTGRVRWKSKYHDPPGHSGSPVIMEVGGKECLALFATYHFVVMRLDRGHEGEPIGKAEWRTDFDCNIPTPAVVGNKALVTSAYNQSKSALFAVSPGGLKRIWTSRACSRVGCPVIHKGRVFFVNRYLWCADLRTGKVLWRGGGFGNGNCLVTGDDKVVVFGNRRVALVDALANDYKELAKASGVVRSVCYPQVALANGVLVCKDHYGNMVCFSLGGSKAAER